MTEQMVSIESEFVQGMVETITELRSVNAELLDALRLCKIFFTVLEDGVVGTEVTDAVDLAILKTRGG